MNSPQAPSKYIFDKKHVKLRLDREETLNAIHFDYKKSKKPSGVSAVWGMISS